MSGETSLWAFHLWIQSVDSCDQYVGFDCIAGPVLGIGDLEVNLMQSLGPLESCYFIPLLEGCLYSCLWHEALSPTPLGFCWAFKNWYLYFISRLMREFPAFYLFHFITSLSLYYATRKRLCLQIWHHKKRVPVIKSTHLIPHVYSRAAVWKFAVLQNCSPVSRTILNPITTSGSQCLCSWWKGASEWVLWK